MCAGCRLELDAVSSCLDGRRRCACLPHLLLVVGGLPKPAEQVAKPPLKHLVLGGVNERVRRTVDEHENDTRVVKRAGEVDAVAEVECAEYHLVERPADDEDGDDRHLRRQDVLSDAIHLVLASVRLTAAWRRGRVNSDDSPQRPVHRRVAEHENGRRQDKYNKSRTHPVEQFPRLGAIRGANRNATAVVYAGRNADE